MKDPTRSQIIRAVVLYCISCPNLVWPPCRKSSSSLSLSLSLCRPISLSFKRRYVACRLPVRRTWFGCLRRRGRHKNCVRSVPSLPCCSPHHGNGIARARSESGPFRRCCSALLFHPKSESLLSSSLLSISHQIRSLSFSLSQSEKRKINGTSNIFPFVVSDHRTPSPFYLLRRRYDRSNGLRLPFLFLDCLPNFKYPRASKKLDIELLLMAG